LLACERTCRSFRWILSFDEVWKTCEGVEEDRLGSSWRENAFILFNTDIVRKRQQNSSESVILSLGTIKWLRAKISNEINDSQYAYSLRGDTVATLVAIVETYMIAKVESAVIIAIMTAKNTNSYPEITEHSIRAVDYITRFSHNPLLSKYLLDKKTNITQIANSQICSKIVRRLSHIGGATKISNEALVFMGEALFSIIFAILHEPIQLYEHLTTNSKNIFFNSNNPIDLHNDIPSIFTNDEKNGKICNCVIVPRQIEESALKISGVFHLVYGSPWALSEGNILEHEVQEAKDRYTVELSPNSEDESEDISLANADCESHFESEESSFSVYSDTECLDHESLNDGTKQ